MQILDNQPISFRPYLETDSPCNLGDRKKYCQLYENGDHLKAQWIVDPCSTLECDPPSDNLTSNPNFTGGASAWTLANGATYNSDAIKFAPDASGSQLSQSIVLDAGKCYLLRFTISNYVAGTTTPTLGSTVGTTVNANGTYTQIITPTTNDLSFSGSTSADLTVDDIFLYNLECFCPDNEDVYVNNQTICHISGTATILTFDVPLVSGKYYGITIEISNQTKGAATIIAGTMAGESFDGNGSFTSFLTSNGTVLTIEMDADFDGCVSFIKADIYPATEDYEIGLFDLDDNWLREIQTYGGINYLTYDENWITLDWFIPNALYYSPAIAEGCYKICLIDPCLEHTGFVYAASLFEDEFDNSSQWTLGSGIAISDGEMTFISNNGGGVKTATANSFPFTNFNGCTFKVRLNFSEIDIAYLGSQLIINIGGASATIIIDAGIISALHVDVQIVSIVANSFSIDFDNTVDPGGGAPKLSIEAMFIKLDQECFFDAIIPDYCSNCISIKQEQPCTVKINAFCNESSLGFNFTNFSLTTRLRTLFINPISKVRNENYKKSNGSYYKNFAEKDKVWEVLFDYMDEIGHDFLATALVCDHMTLYNNSNFIANDEYIWFDDNYKPEWDKDGRQKVAQSRIELRRIDGHLTNSNCS